MSPADNNIAAVGWMTVLNEVTALKLKLDPYTLPPPGINLALRFTVRKGGLNRFNEIAQLASDHTKRKNYTVFIYGFVT